MDLKDRLLRTRGVRSLRSRIVGYVFVRLVLASALIGLASLTVLREPWSVTGRVQLFVLAGATFLFSGASAALMRMERVGRWLVLAQLVFDTCLVSGIVHFTGGAESVFFVLYFMNVGGAAWLAVGPTAVALAGVNTAAYVTIVGWDLGAAHLLDPAIYADLLVKGFGLLLVGGLTGRLALRVQQVDQALAREREATRVLEERYDLVFESVSSGIVTVDPQGRIRSVNPAARNALGRAEGKPLEAVLPGLTPSGPGVEVTVQGPDGGERTLLCHRSPLGGAGEEVVVLDDVTRLRAVERDRERETRLVGIGRFAAAVAHEIRNPLASLSGAVQLIQDEHPGPLLDIASREIRRLNDLVGDFLESARPRVLARQAMDVRLLLEEIAAAFAQDPRYAGLVRVRIQAPENVAMEADPDRLRQVVWNLLLNAAQAMPSGGEVVLSVEETLEQVTVRVRDQGAGIRPEDLPRLFDPFYTTRQGGTGLGLATVHRLVRAHGGQVQAISAPGEGATFEVTLPRRAPEPLPSLGGA